MRDKTTGMPSSGRRTRFKPRYSRPGHGQYFHGFIDQPLHGMDGRDDFLRNSRCGPRETLSGIAFRIIY